MTKRLTQKEMEYLSQYLVKETPKELPPSTFGLWVHPRDLPALLAECARLDMAVDVQTREVPPEGRKYYAGEAPL